MDTVLTDLPDVSITESSPNLSALQWVGMQGLDLPIQIAEAGCREVHARADVQVDLPAAHVKGIHMSRLYRLMDGLDTVEAVTPALLHQVLHAMVESHQDCETTSARLRLSFDLLVRRPALVSAGLAGWKAYPIELRATLQQGQYTLEAQATVTYSSTCPCSAALARQLVEQAFLDAFSERDNITPARVADWLRQHATLATPYSQRSEARVTITLAPQAPSLGLIALIDGVEQAVGTPVQTTVKRADEQAFAALNGQNLMFVEDAQNITSFSYAHVNGAIAFGIMDGENHSTIAFKDKGPKNPHTGPAILRALAVEDADYADAPGHFAWQAEIDAADPKVAAESDRFQNTVTWLADDLSQDVDDYFVEFYRRESEDSNFEQRLYEKLIADVHPYQDNPAYRSLYLSIDNYEKLATRFQIKQLYMSLMASPVYNPPSQPVGYIALGEHQVGGLVLDESGRAQFFQPHRTLLVRITIERAVGNGVFQIH